MVAVAWICFLTIAGCLPELNPVNSQTLNYTPVAVGIVALYAIGSWFLWARKWFKGPIHAALSELAEEPGHPSVNLHKSSTYETPEEKKTEDEANVVAV